MPTMSYGYTNSSSIAPGVQGQLVPNVNFASPSAGFSTGSLLGAAAAGVIRSFLPNSAQQQGPFTVGDRIQITETVGRRRRRRRRLLTCSDKSDIAFLHGQLGGGALGKAAISSLLSRRCG